VLKAKLRLGLNLRVRAISITYLEEKQELGRELGTVTSKGLS
jgi:hypothetical protein